MNVTYATGAELSRVRAKAVVVAAGGWIARRIVRDLPPSYVGAYARFHHGPILVANVAVRNWKAFAKLGISAAHWFDGFGFFVNLRQPMKIDGAPVPLDPSRPAMLTFYVGFPQTGVPIDRQTSEGRALLLGTSFRDSKCRFRAAAADAGQCSFHARATLPGSWSIAGGTPHRAPAGVLLWNAGRHGAAGGHSQSLRARRVWAQ